ncbi:hypothetical protein AURDEDRAFT_112462 [Auricularia subglabra TFB-10046 SS5]|nr:hypothetical protein AURDEDRAFT_112462 [Auricularia subglabra TFB-10046 SS5]
MSHNATSPPTDFIAANLLAESSWGKSFDFSALYKWTAQQANDATMRGRVHDVECHKRAAELEILAKAMRETCATTKVAYARIEGYEILLANVALELRKREVRRLCIWYRIVRRLTSRAQRANGGGWRTDTRPPS